VYALGGFFLDADGMPTVYMMPDASLLPAEHLRLGHRSGLSAAPAWDWRREWASSGVLAACVKAHAHR